MELLTSTLIRSPIADGATSTSTSTSTSVPTANSAVASTSPEARLRAIIDAHGQPLLQYVIRLTNGDRAWAEDVVQDTFVRAWQHIDRLVPERGSVRGWLTTVAHHRVMDGYRAARCRPIVVDIDESYLPFAQDDETKDVLNSIEVDGLLQSLPESNRAAIVAMILADRTAAQAAAFLGVPVGTIKSRVFYGLRMLRTAMEPSQLTA